MKIRSKIFFFASLSVLCALCERSSSAFAQTQPGITNPKHPTREITEEEAEKEKARLEKEVGAAFARKDFAAAEAALRELIPLDHANFVPWYNLACALSMQGKVDEAVKMLQQSIARSFADRHQMETDPHLANLRETDGYKDIIAGWTAILDARAAKNIEAAKKQYRVGEKGSPYVLEQDDALRLIYISAFDKQLFEQSKQEIARLTRWWRTQVLPVEEPWRAEAGKDTPWILVILPTRPDYQAWAQARYGDKWDRIGGAYSHDDRKLVSMDLGSTLRHEYWHVLHWRHMERLGQRQPLWVMEGLCSLPEDISEAPDGSMIAKPSWRTNMVRRLAKAGSLTPWSQMFALDRKQFIGSRPLAFYAQSRAVFMYLMDRGKLRDWYTAYVQTFAEDPTGIAAFIKAFNRPLKETERDFRDWCKALPEVAEEVGSGPANLPVDVSPGSGDGPQVVTQPGIEMLQGRHIDTGGLKFRDIITSIEGQPVRDLNDLARLLGEHEAGDVVEVGYRRGKGHGTTKVKLVPPM